MGLFDKRIAFKPFEYPELIKYREAIRRSRWDVEEFNFDDDIQDFKVFLTDKEKDVIRKTMLSISQVESANVKDFWGKIGENIPKPEVKIVGYTFSENEITHSFAYSSLLEKLGLNQEFDLLLQNPVIQGRVNYLNKYLKQQSETKNQFYTLTLALFSLFVENVSLFSQFAIIKSFKKHKNYLKSIDNVVLATQKDEAVHASFGIEIINIIRKENPDWFDKNFYNKIYEACEKAYEAEIKILDWIFEEGELDFLSSDTLKAFIKTRFNDSLKEIGGKQLFEINKDHLEPLKWFTEEIYGYLRNDFFNTKSVNYNKIPVKAKDIRKSLKRIKDEMV